MPDMAQPNGIPALGVELAKVYVGLPLKEHEVEVDVKEVGMAHSFDWLNPNLGRKGNTIIKNKILTKGMDFIKQFWLRTKEYWISIILTYIHKYNCKGRRY